ncbi:serine/threonine protein kinase [Thecamonas trahens ATCC 50062]|uniref:Serine/threonine protein kinase n=1 Tax=Thecamonas trahens ATCC 50062 TaxID=461836 RepID=A0A0L0D199_THETB|nr:serine/threonine protein kinase [Thecamonas trahens ATCC 50062]KNC46001.1 serine/threonine protein kinase [Thecamonas trahens ATCC 50062]|eukprot:XP_013762981.1 serine/threonine protein kinase [Thecamonas trahens ATCC 50062]
MSLTSPGLQALTASAASLVAAARATPSASGEHIAALADLIPAFESHGAHISFALLELANPDSHLHLDSLKRIFEDTGDSFSLSCFLSIEQLAAAAGPEHLPARPLPSPTSTSRLAQISADAAAAALLRTRASPPPHLTSCPVCETELDLVASSRDSPPSPWCQLCQAAPLPWTCLCSYVNSSDPLSCKLCGYSVFHTRLRAILSGGLANVIVLDLILDRYFTVAPAPPYDTAAALPPLASPSAALATLNPTLDLDLVLFAISSGANLPVLHSLASRFIEGQTTSSLRSAAILHLASAAIAASRPPLLTDLLLPLASASLDDAPDILASLVRPALAAGAAWLFDLLVTHHALDLHAFVGLSSGDNVLHIAAAVASPQSLVDLLHLLDPDNSPHRCLALLDAPNSTGLTPPQLAASNEVWGLLVGLRARLRRAPAALAPHPAPPCAFLATSWAAVTLASDPPLGEGQFSVVRAGHYLAQPVAVKILKADARAPSTHKIFLKELAAVSRMAHPNCVRFVAAIVEETQLVILTELLVFGDLNARIYGARGVPPFPSWSAKIRAVIAVAKGMAFLHGCGMVHRDLKPANVLLEGLGGGCKLADFGLAVLQANIDAGAEHSHVGTPAYMAPEALLGHANDMHSDVWSFGTLLWEVVAEMRPSRQARLANCYALPGDIAFPTWPATLSTLLSHTLIPHEPSARLSFVAILELLDALAREVAFVEAIQNADLYSIKALLAAASPDLVHSLVALSAPPPLASALHVAALYNDTSFAAHLLTLSASASWLDLEPCPALLTTSSDLRLLLLARGQASWASLPHHSLVDAASFDAAASLVLPARPTLLHLTVLPIPDASLELLTHPSRASLERAAWIPAALVVVRSPSLHRFVLCQDANPLAVFASSSAAVVVHPELDALLLLDELTNERFLLRVLPDQPHSLSTLTLAALLQACIADVHLPPPSRATVDALLNPHTPPAPPDYVDATARHLGTSANLTLTSNSIPTAPLRTATLTLTASLSNSGWIETTPHPPPLVESNGTLAVDDNTTLTMAPTPSHPESGLATLALAQPTSSLGRTLSSSSSDASLVRLGASLGSAATLDSGCNIFPLDSPAIVVSDRLAPELGAASETGLRSGARGLCLGADVAIKDVAVGALDGATRLLCTIHAAAHPYVVSLMGIQLDPRETAPSRVRLIRERIKGTVLTEALSRRVGNLMDAPSEIVRVLYQLAQALVYLHSQLSLPHGSLTPSNVVLTQLNATVMLTDHGQAALEAAALEAVAASGERIPELAHRVDLAYAPPEVLKGTAAATSLAADIWAFGCIAWLLLSNSHRDVGRPIRPYDELSSLSSRFTRPNEPPGIFHADIPPALTSLFQACWSPHPDARPPAADLAASLALVLEPPPLSGFADSTTLIADTVVMERCLAVLAAAKAAAAPHAVIVAAADRLVGALRLYTPSTPVLVEFEDVLSVALALLANYWPAAAVSLAALRLIAAVPASALDSSAGRALVETATGDVWTAFNALAAVDSLDFDLVDAALAALSRLIDLLHKGSIAWLDTWLVANVREVLAGGAAIVDYACCHASLPSPGAQRTALVHTVRSLLGLLAVTGPHLQRLSLLDRTDYEELIRILARVVDIQLLQPAVADVLTVVVVLLDDIAFPLASLDPLMPPLRRLPTKPATRFPDVYDHVFFAQMMLSSSDPAHVQAGVDAVVRMMTWGPASNWPAGDVTPPSSSSFSSAFLSFVPSFLKRRSSSTSSPCRSPSSHPAAVVAFLDPGQRDALRDLLAALAVVKALIRVFEHFCNHSWLVQCSARLCALLAATFPAVCARDDLLLALVNAAFQHSSNRRMFKFALRTYQHLADAGLGDSASPLLVSFKTSLDQLAHGRRHPSSPRCSPPPAAPGSSFALVDTVLAQLDPVSGPVSAVLQDHLVEWHSRFPTILSDVATVQRFTRAILTVAAKLNVERDPLDPRGPRPAGTPPQGWDVALPTIYAFLASLFDGSQSAQETRATFVAMGPLEQTLVRYLVAHLALNTTDPAFRESVASAAAASTLLAEAGSDAAASTLRPVAHEAMPGLGLRCSC